MPLPSETTPDRAPLDRTALDPRALDALAAAPTARLAAATLAAACGGGELGEFLTTALGQWVRELGVKSALALRPAGGSFETLGQAGDSPPPPFELLADALDREAVVSRPPWVACPLGARAAGQFVLAANTGGARHEEQRAALAALAPVLAHGLATVERRHAERRRIRRLEAILEIAGRWSQTQEMGPLLTQMAEAATRLLGADRASIFLWDRPNHLLVGRPALGLDEDELRIPDNAGLVGRVVQTGQPGRVDRRHGQEEINRAVDRATGYTTQTLLCVPLTGKNKERFGAFEVLNKKKGDFSDDDEQALTELAAHAAIALENTQERQALLQARRVITDQAAQGVRLVGESAAIANLKSSVARVAKTELAVLVLGENGTGKEVVSQSIHYLSGRRDQPFIAVNCAAITETLLESELFGHEKGAFTGADETRIGKFELAHGGTLFLDEIGDMSSGGQAKLLRVLEEKLVVRVGGSKPIHADVRVIAATNQDLGKLVREKRFRQDLFFRLNVVTLELPPLRERAEDVMLLARHFLGDFSRRAGRTPPAISPAAEKKLLKHPWPGNVRELRNAMERLAYLTAGDVIEAADLHFMTAADDEASPWISSELPLTEATAEFQIEFIKQAIAKCRNNMSEAAKRLGLHRSNLYRKMRQLGMETGEEGE